jgi:hypothetical protein
MVAAVSRICVPRAMSRYIQLLDVRLCMIQATTSLWFLAVTIDEVERDSEVADTYCTSEVTRLPSGGATSKVASFRLLTPFIFQLPLSSHSIGCYSILDVALQAEISVAMHEEPHDPTIS